MRIIAATKNPGKIAEFSRILEPMGLQVLSQSEIGIEFQPKETGESFQENARLKAQAIHQRCGEAVIADDSGLCVDALDGAPGIYSARYGGEKLSDRERVTLLLRSMRDVPDELRTARFICALCYIDADGTIIEVQAACEGEIGHIPTGSRGFGYDPIFLVDGMSFASITASEKDRIGHRGKALALLAQKLEQHAKEKQPC